MFMEVGAVMVAASVGGSIITLMTAPLPAASRKLRKAFKVGEICIKKDKSKIFPSIKNMSILPECIRAIFVIPQGLDPAEVTKKEWVFRQIFGDQIELNEVHTAKVFQLKIYFDKVQMFDYNFANIKDAIEHSKLSLPVVVGRSRQGWESYDMVKHPGLLIAAETGGGKSTALRSILTTLIKTVGDKIELYLADLKMSEFHLFNRLPQVRMNVTEKQHIPKLFYMLTGELERRKRLLNKHEVAHIDELPSDIRSKYKYIIFVVDEFGDLTDQKKDEVITLAQQARAFGMYLILSTQRPDREVIDGKIKLNLTVRIAGRVGDQVNSRIILDSDEAAHIKPSEKGRVALKGVNSSVTFVQVPNLELEDAKELLANEKLAPATKQTQGTDGDRGNKEVSSPAPGSDRNDMLPRFETNREDSGNERDVETTGEGPFVESRSEDEDVSIFDIDDLPVSKSEKRWDNDHRYKE